MAALLKHALRRCTGIVGLEKVADPHSALLGVYKETLAVLGEMPADAPYRISTEALTVGRLAVVNAEKEIEAIETKIGHGQAEELIQQAEDELSLAKNMGKWQPWQVTTYL